MVYDHLIAIGFLKGYTIWVNHGEEIPSRVVNDDDTDNQEDWRDDIDGILYDTFRNLADTNTSIEGPSEEAKKFYNLINEAKQELYHGCESFSTLSFMIRLITIIEKSHIQLKHSNIFQ